MEIIKLVVFHMHCLQECEGSSTFDSEMKFLTLAVRFEEEN